MVWRQRRRRCICVFGSARNKANPMRWILKFINFIYALQSSQAKWRDNERKRNVAFEAEANEFRLVFRGIIRWLGPRAAYIVALRPQTTRQQWDGICAVLVESARERGNVSWLQCVWMARNERWLSRFPRIVEGTDTFHLPLSLSLSTRPCSLLVICHFIVCMTILPLAEEWREIESTDKHTIPLHCRRFRVKCSRCF